MLGFYLFAILFAAVIVAVGKFSGMPVRKDAGLEAGSALTLVFIALVMGGWIAATYGETIESRWLSPIILPSPLEVLRAFPVLHYNQALVRSVLISFGRVTSGFTLAAIIAIPLGIQMAAYPKIAAFFRPLALIGGYVPIVVFIPLSLAWFGIGETQKIGFLFIGCFVVLLPAVIRAIDDVPDDYLNLAATKGATLFFFAAASASSICAASMLELAIQRILPCFLRSSSAPSVSAIGTLGSGLCR